MHRVDDVLTKSLWLACAWLCGTLFPLRAAMPDTQPELALAPYITLSGLSSGGYMAGQYHQAYAEEIRGVAIIAAGPIFCAQQSLQRAFTDCMANPQASPDLASIEQHLEVLRAANLLASLHEVAKSHVWLFSGTMDKTVASPVVAALAEQYRRWLPDAQLTFINDQPFAHHFPTSLPDLPSCDQSVSPFLASCRYDAAGKLLEYVLNRKLSAAVPNGGQLYTINQFALAPAARTQLAEQGYLYVPEQCAHGASCELHVSFHGCRQDASQIGEEYIRKTGLNEYANSNNIVVLYPQVEKSAANPMGCWDWWGYSSADYIGKNAPQIVAVKQLIDALR